MAKAWCVSNPDSPCGEEAEKRLEQKGGSQLKKFLAGVRHVQTGELPLAGPGREANLVSVHSR